MVSDMAHLLFKEIEMKIYPMIEEAFQDKRKFPTKDITKAATDDPDIQFLWTIVAVDIPDIFAQELLTKLVEEWVILRTHSFGRRLKETYKTSKGV